MPTQRSLAGAGGAAQLGRNSIAFVVALVLMSWEFAAIGVCLRRSSAGVIIDARNCMSLSRFQACAWTVLILSALLVGAAFHLSAGSATALNINIPPELLVAMGISATSLATVPAVLNLKTKQQPFAAAVDSASAQLTPPGAGLPVAVPRAGTLIIWHKFAGNGIVDQLPKLVQSFIWLLGVSHASYLAFKAYPMMGKTGLRKLFLEFLAANVLLGSGAAAAVEADSVPSAPGVAEREAATSRAMETLSADPQRLELFLRAMPKGGDLHMHMDGAVYAERFIEWAAADHSCVDRVSLSIVAPPCRGPKQPPVQEAIEDEDLYHRLIDVMSMRDFVPGAQSGHDHFFASFQHFQGLDRSHAGDMAAELVAQAAGEHVLYLEVMISPQMLSAAAVGKRASAAAEDFQGLASQLADPIEALRVKANADIAAMESQKNRVLKCGTAEATPGCQVTIRYLAQVLRGTAPAQVFAQDLLAFRLAESNPLVVGINLVEPEDNRQILADYSLQMRQLRWLHEQHPTVKQSLHAGELAPGLVPPSDLRFHIKQAVEIAGALRIGHGVDIVQEDDAPELLRRMARDHVMVEINLTSNAQILGIQGAMHPFMTYRALGVPVALSTDDQGVSRIDLTHEYLRAVTTYHLGYESLKELSRNSLEYAFLDPGTKARVQASLETAYRGFEAAVAGESAKTAVAP